MLPELRQIQDYSRRSFYYPDYIRLYDCFQNKMFEPFEMKIISCEITQKIWKIVANNDSTTTN